MAVSTARLQRLLIVVMLLQSTSRAFRISRHVGKRSLSTIRWPADNNRVLPIRIRRPAFCRLFSATSSTFDNTVDLDLSNDSSLQQHNDVDDTIYALSSGAAAGTATAVAVIRISGPQAHAILQKLTPNQQPVPTRKAVVRTLHDPFSNTNALLDQALVLKFDAPASFTGQDVVELHVHGSRAVIQGVLQCCGQFHGLRMAERGEFTQRAFGSGKLDLLEVEALADLLAADTRLQRQQALQQLEGQLSQLYDTWRTQLTKGLAHAEAVIDFGDDEQLDANDEAYDSGQANVWGTVGERIQDLVHSMQSHLKDARRGELVREGLKLTICGPPNSGKSSLFNLLAKRDAAIVSPIEGTTRDVLELTMDLGGVRCTLSDTAGVRDSTNDVIEQEGIRRAQKAAKQADIIVAMIDGSAPNATRGLAALSEILVDKEMMDRCYLVINKLDLKPNGDSFTTVANAWQGQGSFQDVFEISCTTSQGLDSFLNALTDRVVERVFNPDDDNDDSTESALITRARHRQHVESAVQALERFLVLSQQGTVAVDMAAEELRLATSELGRITGAVDVEDVLDVLFKDFCIGK